MTLPGLGAQSTGGVLVLFVIRSPFKEQGGKVLAGWHADYNRCFCKTIYSIKTLHPADHFSSFVNIVNKNS